MTQVIILPGLDGTGALVQEFIAALPGDWQVVALRYPTDCASYPACMQWVRDQLPDAPFYLIAESFSGPVAIGLSADPLLGLKGTVFVASFAKTPRPFLGLFWPLAYMLPLTNAVFARMAQPIVMGRWRNAAFTRLFAASLASVSARTMAERLRAVARVDALAELPQIKVPTLYLRASADVLVPKRAGRLFERVQQVEGPHFLLQGNPAACAEAVRAFVAELEA